MPFTAVQRGELLRVNYQAPQTPTIVVIADPKEIDTFAQQVLEINARPSALPDQRHRLVDQLRQIDYSQSVAILVLQGMKGTLGYHVTIQQIRQQNNEIRIYALFQTPESIWDSIFGAKVRQPMFSDAHHLVTVPKETLKIGQVRFVLMDNDTLVAETTRSIP